jgi:hypothetical protein
VGGLLLLIGGFVLLLAIVLVISLGLGWLLTLIVPLALFEGTTLILLAMGFTLYLVRSVVQSAFSHDLGLGPFATDVLDNPVAYSRGHDWPIKPPRFRQENTDDTWKNYFHYVVANQLYLEMEKEREIVPQIAEPQRKELAVRLADIAIETLIRLKPQNGEYRVTITALKREISRRGLKTFDKSLLQMTMYVVNAGIQQEYLLYEVVADGLWADKCSLTDW